MCKKVTLNKFLAFIIISLFIVMLISPIITAIDIKKNNLDILEHSTLNNYEQKASSNLIIENIICGLGITVVIKNNGTYDISNITLNITISGGTFIIIPESVYRIQILYSGQSIESHIRIFGIGLGKNNPYPEITITPRAAHTHAEKRMIIAKIIGPFVKKVGDILNNPNSYDGYTLFSPMMSINTYLIDNNGEIAHKWESKYTPGLSAYLLENGNLLRTASPLPNTQFLAGGSGGRVEIIDWNGTVIWKFDYSTENYLLHHDVEMLPNGNILMIAWDVKNYTEAIDAGRNPNLLPMKIWPGHIIEVEPTGSEGGNIVWEWYVWDHLIQDFDPTKDNYGVIADHPELIDINYAASLKQDFTHINSIDYNEKYDQILLSVHAFNEIWIIDHSTTTEEAADHSGGRYGKGGDMLYRWGNPQTYHAGSDIDQMLFGQHDAQWIEAGCPGEDNIIIFNNGVRRPGGMYSSVDEIIPPIDSDGNYAMDYSSAFGPEGLFWTYTAENPKNFFSINIAGAQRLPNGNTLICEGTKGRFFEISLEKETLWEYINNIPNLNLNHVFKIQRYSPDYPGLKNILI